MGLLSNSSEILHMTHYTALAKRSGIRLLICLSSSRLAVFVPDINASRSLFHLSQVRATAGLVDAVAHWDECVLFLCAPGVSTAAVLDPAETELSGHRLRCVRAYGPASGALALRDLIAQMVGRADPDALTDQDLRAGFVTLTEPGEDYDRVVLLVTEAHNLQPSALDYIQLACQTSLKLRVALAGQPRLAVTLAAERFAYLRQSMTRTLELPGPMPDELLDLVSETPLQFSIPVARSAHRARPLIRLGVIALLALLVGAIGWRYMPAPSAAVIRAEAPAPYQQTMALGTMTSTPAEPDAAEPRRPGMAEQQDAQVSPPDMEQADMEQDAAVPLLPSRASVFAVRPEAPQSRGDRGSMERVAVPMAILASHSRGERRCRDIVLHAQLGKDLSDAEKQFLRDDCRAK